MTIITGVTFPIPKEYVSRFFNKGNTVFVKPATCFKEIKPGIKFVIYQSHEELDLLGKQSLNQ